MHCVNDASTGLLGERGRGRLVELGAVHLLLVRFTAEHVSPWLSKQRKPSGVAVKRYCLDYYSLCKRK